MKYSLTRILSFLLIIPLWLVIIPSDLFRKAWYSYRRYLAIKKVPKILDWIKTQNLPLDTADGFELPYYLSRIDVLGFVEALHTSNDCYCIIIKLRVGLRTDFQGILYCDSPLSSQDFGKGYDDCDCIHIPGRYSSEYRYSFKNLVIIKRYNNHLFEVNYHPFNSECYHPIN
ncbi:hypothetical protein [Dendronalium sp. ChiSLP03b]|uniref:hypothetical protein n=1 Tax=Dendronalium sp. ChiSLP03b TaxID=3075381 RepID=UPI002AD4F057|nr:hypothetical protein [Dendronalium sp. ChiSLP03b]MDZ8205516.1 hypothetical protein [Dendronalium sp. ChiSLP03b]